MHHHCAMTLRHHNSQRAMMPRCQTTQRHCSRAFLSGTQNVPPRMVTRPDLHHHRMLSAASRPLICRAAKTQETSIEREADSRRSGGGNGKASRFGVATKELNQLTDSAPQDVFKSQTSIIRSAAQLAHLLESSLTGGLSESSAQMADRGSTLGKNSLPERNQVHPLSFPRVPFKPLKRDIKLVVPRE